MSQVGADTKLGKNLSKELATVEKQVDALGRKLNQRISSEGQITRLKDQLDGLDNKIKQIGQSLQGVKYEDLSPDYITNKFKDLESELDNIGKKIQSNFNLDSLKGNEKLVQIFKDLGISMKDVNLDNFKSTLTSALEESKKKAGEYREEIARLKKEQQGLNKKTEGKELFADGGVAKAASQLMEGIDPNSFKMVSQNTVDSMKQSLMSAVDTFDNKELAEKLKAQLEQSFNVTDAGTLANNLKTLLKDMVAAAGGDLEKNTQTFLREKLNAALSSLGSEFNLNDILNFKNYTEADTAVLDTVRQRLTELLKVNDNLNKNGDQTAAFIEKQMSVFANGDYAAAIRNIVQALDYYVNAINRAKAQNLEDLQIATNGRDDANLLSQRIAGIINGYKSQIEILQKKNAALKEQLNQSKEEATKEPRTTGGDVARSSNEGLNENIRLVRQYTQELENAKNAEQLVGKIEGIAQRWFSVYAAVNMVTNAVRSMKSTIEELDKTITEIAIVTDMSQSDLWRQMDSYTSMAREYAASISGVYKVSQLYYQQGLQTADVMALTESTLKMARISGLDYADATNYMTNAVRSFKMEMSEADRVVDVYSAIAAKSATDVSELAVAMSKTASSAEAVGSSFENTAAMMAVMIEATRESSQNIGSAMKSIISRYGELKENPSKLVDSEGEELSLNKVDTALQSVGISIHDAQGQFREFDDVIMELAEAWDTIDVNTQRYIATVMAGNRQQSRFLALVSSGERLKELATDAADAENASQLQFLKTLDSIGAKSQQLQTSLQSLYTSSGLEGFYKSILDIANAIVIQFNDIPRLFNLPIPAILSFASTFYSLADVVTNIFGIILNRIALYKQQVNNQLLGAGNDAIRNISEQGDQALSAEQDNYNQRLAALREFLTKKLQMIESFNNGQTPEEAILKSQQAGQTNIQAGISKTVNSRSMLMNLGSLGLGLAATAGKSSTNRNAQVAGGFAGIGSRALSGAAMGSMIPGIGTGVGAAIGTIIGAFENLNAVLPSTAEQLKNLTEIADNAKNKALQEQAESKSLQSSIDKIKELEKARYNSIEAEQEYAKACDALASKYPELITYYNESGQAIINTAQASELLATNLQKTTEAIIEAAAANLMKAKKEKEAEDNQTEETTISGKAEATNILSALLSQGYIQNSGTPPKSFSEATGTDIQTYIRANAGNLDLNQVSDSEFVANQQDFSKSDKYNELIAEYASKSEEEFTGWLQKNVETFKELAQQSEDLDTQALGKIFLEIAKSLNVGITSFAASESKLNAQVESDVKLVMANLYNQEKNAESEVAKTLKDNEAVYKILQDMAVQAIGSPEQYITEEAYKAALANLDLSSLYEQLLRSLPNGKDINDFITLIASRESTSKGEFIQSLSEWGISVNNEIYQALISYYDDSYDYGKLVARSNKLQNKQLQQAFSESTAQNQYDLLGLEKYEQNTSFGKLTGSQLQSVGDKMAEIDSLISSGQLTEQQGVNYFKQYLSVWTSIESSLAGETKEATKQLFQSWDGTESGLTDILASLENAGINENNEVYKNISNLIPLLSQNINTIFATISASVASEIKTMDDAIKDLSKGVDMGKAIEYANKLGLSLKDFQLDYSTGLFTLNDTQKIIQKQIDNVDKQISNAQQKLNKYTNSEATAQISVHSVESLRTFSEISDLSNLEDEAVKEFQGFAESINVTPEELQYLLQRYFKEVENTSQTTFTRWVQEVFQKDIDYLSTVSENAQARGALQLGDLTGFLVNALKGILVNGSDVEKIITSLVANSGINEADLEANGVREEIITALLKYSNLLNDTFKNTTQDVYNKAIESITKGEQEIEVTDTNESLLDELGITDEFERDGKKYRKANWSGMTVGSTEYTNAVNKLLANGVTEEEKSILEALENALTNNNPAQALNDITSSWQEVGQTAALLFKSAFDLSDTDFNKIFSFDEISKTYTTDLKALREKIRNNNKLSQKQRNEQLAKIDKELQETSVQSTFSDLVKNANNLSEDIIRTWADSIGANYAGLANLWRQNDGTYKIDLAGLVQNKKILEQKGEEFAAGVLDSIIDEYLSQLSNISQVQTSGYTNLSDMREVANQFANGDLGIFQWDKELKAYTLTNGGIMQQAKAAADQLKSLDKNSQEYEKAYQLMQADGQALAENIDFLGLVNAVGTDDYSDAVRTFNKSVADYNAYLIGTGQQIRVSALNLQKAAQEGGLAAVKAAQDIAKQAGKKLEGSDVEAIYRSGANKINTALEQVSLSVGSVIDSTTVELLGIQGQVTDLGSGKYVINSSIDLVEAHQQLLRAMYEDNTYTLSELNALQAKVMAGNEQADLLESMGNISELTYDTLGQIAEQAGYSLYSLYGELAKNNAVKNLGGGKIRITDFDYFADLIGLTDKSSEEYIQVLSKYNDEVISYNRSRAEAVVGELKALSEAKAGDQINISNIMGQFGENTRKLLETTLSAATGAELKNGILNINDANIAAILGYFRDISKDFEGISERDRAEIEDAFETLLNNITEQIKQGLQGKLSNVGKLDLQNSLSSNYGIKLGDSDFAKTADGFKMTEQAAIRVYNTIKQIDAAQGQLVLTELNNSLKESNEHYKSMGDIMNRIAQLKEKIDNPNDVSPVRLQEYKEELAVAQEIAQVRATTDSSESFSFMDNKLPGAMENPLTYAENWGKAINILQKQSSGTKKGFIDARDWYNIANEMNNIAKVSGQSIDLFGYTLSGKMEDASKLIEAGFSHLKSIDGGKMQVDIGQVLGGIGTAFEQGALDSEGKITKGIHAMAESQINMLDGLIAMLETIVAMQDAFAGLKASKDNKLDFGELFENLMPTGDLKIAADRLLKKFPDFNDPNNPLVKIKINGETLAKLLEDAKTGVKFSEENAQGLAAAMNGLYQAMLSGNYDLDNIYASVKEVLQQSGLTDGKLSIDIGNTTLYLTGNVITQIDWESDKVKKALEDAYQGKKKDGKSPREQADAAMREFQKKPQNLLGEGKEADLKFVLQTNTNVTYDAKKKTYTVDGHEFTDPKKAPKEAYKALLLKQTSNLSKLTFDDKDNLTGGVIEGKTGTKVTMTINSEGRISYTYVGPDGTSCVADTPEKAIRAYYASRRNLIPENMSLDDIVHNENVNLDLDSSTGITFNGKDQDGNKTNKPTLTQSKQAQELLNDPNIQTYEQLREYSKEHPKLGLEVDSSLKGPLSVADMQKIAEIYGVDYKMESKQLSLSVSLAEGTSATLQNLLTGESATATLEITPTITGSTTSGEGNNSTITLGEQTITAPVKILPTSVQIGDNPEQGIPIPTEQLIKAPVKINPQGTSQLGDAQQGITIETEQLVNAPIRVNPTDVQLNGNTFLYDKALTVYAAISNLKLLPGEGGTTAVEGGTGNPLSEQAKAQLQQIVDTIWSDESINTVKALQATAYLGEILFATNEATVNTPPKIVVPQDWIGEKSLLKVDKILTFLYDLEYKPTEAAKTTTIQVDTPGPLETIDIEQPYRIVFVPEGEGGNNEPQQPAGLSMGAEQIQGGIIAGNSDYSNYLDSMWQYLQKGGTLSQAGANSISQIANATRDNAGTQKFYEKFFGEDGGLFNIDEQGNISAMTTQLQDMGEVLDDGELIGNMQNLSTLVLEVNSTDSNGLAALWTVLTELKDAAATFMQGPWKDVTSVLNDLSSLNIEAKTLTIDTVLTGQTWALELLKDLSNSTMNLNLNLGGTTTMPPQQPLVGQTPAAMQPIGTMTTASLLGGMTGSYAWTGTGQVPGTQWMGGAYSGVTPTTPTTGEQPELDTDGLEKGIEKVNEQISNISTSVDNITKAISEFTSQADAVNGAVSDIGSAVSTLQSSISTFATDAGTGASNAEAAAKALKGIPKNIPINAKVTMSIDATVTGPGGAAGNVEAKITDIKLSPEKIALTSAKAKGTNLALPKGNAQTLMGELGPELYVTNGRYYVAGQSGPEFVDLPKDAIVFNHVKTKQLLKNGKTSGHGKPVTNEKNAISFATGTPGGPAMASASAALAALKQLRAMWASLLKSSAKDLGSQAGRGGGGGGDDAGKYVQPTTTTADIQRWYNWLRQIDKIEKDITYQEKLQKKYETDRVANGQKIFDTQKERLKLLDQEILRNERLADLQKSWYDNKRKELEESSYGKIFTYDENGLQQYVGSGKPGSGLGLDILEHLTKRDVRGEAIGDAATSKAQLKYLASVGFNLNDLIYNDDGTKVVKKINQKTLSLTRMPDDEDTDASELYTKLMENFWSKVDGWRDELDSLYDSYQQQLAKIEDNQTKQNQIIEGFVKNELSVEKELLKAVEAREQAVIDKLQEQKDALEKANANYIKGIQKALEKERQIEQKNDQQENLTKLQRQLSILQRSGGGAAQIKQLQDQIAQSQKDMYFNDRQEEINAVQEASDKQLEKLDQQIQILSETLEYQKKNGLLWNQVREIMEGGDEFATAFYDKWVTSKSGESALNMEEDLRAFKESFQEWVGFRESKEEDRLAKEDMESIANSEKYGESNANYLEGFADDKERSAAQKAAEDAANTARDNYLKSHEDEDEASREANARAAAEKAYHESLQSSYMSTTGNKEVNQQFAENYGSWLENRRISDANDFTNTETFKQNENVFKNAMQAYYLEHRNDEGVSEQELWQNAINAGQQALEEDITENYQEALENSAQVIGGKAVSYTWDSVKGKMKKNSKITYGEGTSLNFDDAKEVLEGKKLKHYLHVKGMGDNGWVLANSIYTGERIYSQLAGNQAWQGRNGNLADMINGMNGYYGANGLTNTVDISDLKSGSLKFPGTQIPLENGGFATLGKNGNTVRISDFSSITFDKKNPDKKISKLGKNMTITAIQTPDMSKMENLQNPMTIKTNGTIKKKLNDLLAADRGSLKNLLQYLGNYDINEIRRYATGGMNYYTGPAWLDGTKARPEAVLNSSQTSFLRNDLLGNSKDSLKSIVYSLQDSIRGAAIGSSSTTNNDGMVIENIDVTFSPGVISNDYDMRQASEVFKNEIVKIARKSGSRSVSRR